MMYLIFGKFQSNVKEDKQLDQGGVIGQMLEEAAVAGARRRTTWRVEPFDLSDADFRKNFRLSKNLVVDLMNTVEPYVPQKDIDLKTKVLCTLNFVGTGSYQTPVGNNYLVNMCQTSVSRCIWEIINALNHDSVFSHWVHFPQTFQEMNEVVRDFYRLYGFPGITGAIDCTHVAIVPPNKNFDERAYVNRKFYHSINTQLICDAKLKILNVNALFPGGSHDQHIWNTSNVLTLMQQLQAAGHTQYHLIGDSGYALRPWCLTPVRDPEEGTAEFRYNEVFKRARATIERCNGVIKGRFRCLIKDRVLHYTPPRATKIINACTVLHNMCINANIEDPQMNNLNDDELGIIQPPHLPGADNAGPRGNYLLTQGRAKRARIINQYFG